MDVQLLAGRIVRRFWGRFPVGVTAADAKQDAVVALLEQAPLYDPECGVPRDAWLVTRCAGILRDRYGREWKKHYAHPSQGVDSSIISDSSPDHTHRLDVQEALASLSPRQREALELWMGAWTQAEIARRMDVAQPYVCELLKRARAKMKDALGDGYGN